MTDQDQGQPPLRDGTEDVAGGEAKPPSLADLPRPESRSALFNFMADLVRRQAVWARRPRDD